jgi:ankyrin repeat protein
VRELGANVNGTRSHGATPLYVAAQNDHLAVVRCLVNDLGADTSQAFGDGATPLHIAAQQGHLGVVRCMLGELGADVNQARHCGSTPLHIAARNGHLPVVRCLVKEFGADVDRVKNDGVTPLMIAASMKHENVVEFLLKYGANPQLSGPSYGTAADVSKIWGARWPSRRRTSTLGHTARCPNAAEWEPRSARGVLRCITVRKRECQLAHWAAHKADCKRSAEACTGIYA